MPHITVTPIHNRVDDDFVLAIDAAHLTLALFGELILIDVWQLCFYLLHLPFKKLVKVARERTVTHFNG